MGLSSRDAKEQELVPVAGNAPQVIDLFAGAGGLSLGMATAGLRVALGADNWAPAANTYRNNLDDHPFFDMDLGEAESSEILKASGVGHDPWALVGGPPCQGFSSAGVRRKIDHRNTLVGRFAEIAAELKPDVFIFENVEGFFTTGRGEFVVDLLDPLIESGYQIILQKINVANFGVPQLRKRVICIASLGRPPADLVPTHRAFGAPGAWRVGKDLPLTRTIMEAIQDLPVPSPVAPGEPQLHFKPGLSPRDQLRVAVLKQGQTMRDLPSELWHNSYHRRANRRVADGVPTERRGGAPAGLRRLIADEPSKAITSAASREFIHPLDDRPLTLRECARIQTFPDWFNFMGSRSDIAKLIGNAVPPAFAEAIGHAIVTTLSLPKCDTGGGRLISFDVTSADAMSPALKHVVNLVRDRYGGRARCLQERTTGRDIHA